MSEPWETAGYAAMLGELEAILADLESGDVDVDVLAQQVARAAALVEACRDRIERARLEVERIVATIDDPPDRTQPASPSP